MNRLRGVFALLMVVTLISGQGAALVSGQDAPVGSSVTEFQLPGSRPVSMSPDGTMVVSVEQGAEICVYLTASGAEVTCASLDEIPAQIALADIAWSPDSTRIAFALDAFRFYRDSDIWVMDAQTGDLTNLTEDDYDESLFPGDAGTEFFVDVAPTWHPDGQTITFSRSFWTNGETAGSAIAEVPAEGGEAVTLAMIDAGRPAVMYLPGAWAPDGSAFYFTADYMPAEPLQSGIWMLDPETGETRLIAHTEDPELGLLALRSISPTGDRLLAYYPIAAVQGPITESVQRFVDPQTGEITSIPAPLPESETYQGSWFSTFSPDGRYLLQPWVLNSSFDYWVTNLETGESSEVATDLIMGAPVDYQLSPVWATNGKVAVAQDVTGFYLFSIDGVGLSQATPSTEGTPAATTPVSASGTPVGGPVRAEELPEGRAVSMSPDGHYLAVAVPPQESLCVYDVATMAEVSCADLSVLNTNLRMEDIVWSPDSTRLAFSEQTFITFKDGDLWVMDAATGTLTNLTDDGYDGNILSLNENVGDDPFFADVSPAWTPDSEFITFSRTLSGEGGVLNNVVAQIPATGGDVVTLAEVGDSPGIFYYRGQWSPDGQRFYYSVIDPDPNNPENGIWVYDKISGEASLLAVSDDPEFGPLALRQVSPSGDRLLAYFPNAVARGGYINRSILRFVDPVTGELSPVPDPAPESEIFEGTWIATFSPDGQYFLQATGLDAGARDFWVTNLSTGEVTQVADDLERAVPIEYELGPVWGTDGTVFVAWNVTGAYFFPIDGVGTEPVAPQAVATPVSAAEALVPGDTAVTNGMTPVFAAPDANATVVHILAPNQLVQILGEPVENAQGIWYPVLDPETQIIGYVQASRLE